MFLHSVSPTGDYTSIDLNALAVWRLGISAKAMEHGKPAQHVALMLAYPANVPSGVNRIVIAAVDIKVPNEAEGIVGIGMPKLDLDSNRARLYESAKVLFNSEAIRKEADVIAAKVSQLADIYHGILDACGATKAESKDLSTPISSDFKGELEGWKFAVTPGRFDQWRTMPNTFRPVNEQVTNLAAPVVPPTAMGIGAPPPPGSKPPEAPKRLTREAQRKLDAQTKAATGAAGTPPAPSAPSDQNEPEVLTPEGMDDE